MELIEDESPWTAAAAIYLVKIGYDERALREQIKATGARWDPQHKFWTTTGDVIRRLGLHDRESGWLETK